MMSKVVCEICGTAYPNTEAQCPVCGYESPVTADFMGAFPDTDEVAAPVVTGSAKGGRFTKSNVNKRMQSASEGGRKNSGKKRKNKKSRRRKSRGGFVIILVILLLGILAVAGFLFVKNYLPGLFPDQNTQPSDPPVVQTNAPDTQPPAQTDAPQTQPTTVPTEPEDLSCTALKLGESAIRFNKPGNAWLLNVIPTPANTTDPITFHSEDESVAKVDEFGKVTAVGAGETVIVITCGDQTIACQVSCKDGPAHNPTENTEPGDKDSEEDPDDEPDETEPQETKPADAGDFKLNREDFTLGVGESWQLYKGDIDPSEITWASSNTSVATVSNGRVKGVGKGQA